MGVMRHTDRSLRSSSAATGFMYRAIYCFALLCFALLCFALLCFALAFDLLLIYLPLREAEWRFCAVGLPAWMPGEPCWAKDGPSRRAHGAGPERGTPERSEGRTPGQGLFGYFCGCLTKVPRRKGETRRKPWRIERICTLFSCSIAAKTTETPSTYPPQTPNWNRGIRVVCTFP